MNHSFSNYITKLLIIFSFSCSSAQAMQCMDLLRGPSELDSMQTEFNQYMSNGGKLSSISQLSLFRHYAENTFGHGTKLFKNDALIDPVKTAFESSLTSKELPALNEVVVKGHVGFTKFGVLPIVDSQTHHWFTNSTTLRLRSLSEVEQPIAFYLSLTDTSRQRTRKHSNLEPVIVNLQGNKVIAVPFEMSPGQRIFTFSNNLGESQGFISIQTGSVMTKTGKLQEVALLDRMRNVPNSYALTALKALDMTLTSSGIQLVLPKSRLTPRELNQTMTITVPTSREILSFISTEELGVLANLESAEIDNPSPGFNRQVFRLDLSTYESTASLTVKKSERIQEQRNYSFVSVTEGFFSLLQSELESDHFRFLESFEQWFLKNRNFENDPRVIDTFNQILNKPEAYSLDFRLTTFESYTKYLFHFKRYNIGLSKSNNTFFKDFFPFLTSFSDTEMSQALKTIHEMNSGNQNVRQISSILLREVIENLDEGLALSILNGPLKELVKDVKIATESLFYLSARGLSPNPSFLTVLTESKLQILDFFIHEGLSPDYAMFILLAQYEINPMFKPDSEIIQFLLEAGANPNLDVGRVYVDITWAMIKIFNQTGYLGAAIKHNDKITVEILLKNGAEVTDEHLINAEDNSEILIMLEAPD